MLLITNFIRANWKYIAAIGLVLAAFVFGFYRGYEHEKKTLDATIAQYTSEAKIAEAHNTEVVKQQQKVSEDITKEYANAVEDLKTYYANHPSIKWMRADCKAGSEVSNVSNTTEGTDAGTQNDTVSTEGITPLDCADTTLQLIKLQQWVKEQQGIN